MNDRSQVPQNAHEFLYRAPLMFAFARRAALLLGGLSPGILGLAALGCPAESVPAANSPAASAAEERDPERSRASEKAPQPDLEPERPCTNEECVPCGEGLCPEGFFCDESGPSSGCGWLPDCTSDRSCRCLERRLPGCKCRQENEGTYLKCE